MTQDVPPGTHVVLGTGQTGRHVAQVLLEVDADVRVVNRSGEAPGAIADDVDVVAADVSRSDAAISACGDAAVVYCCLQVPYTAWPDRFPPLLDAVVNGAAEADARFVLADNLYMYGPVSGPITEDLPYAATSRKGRVRAAMAETVLEAHDDGGVRATIGRASDFYGPGVTGSLAGERLFPAVLSGGTVWFLGDPDAPHTYTYIRDFAEGLVTLGANESALGEAWHVPSAETMTTREFVALAGEVAGTEPTVRRLPSWLMGVVGRVSSTIGELREIRYQFEEPFEVSHEKFATSFELEPTPHREAIAETLEWYEQEH